MTEKHKAIPAAYLILKKDNQVLLLKRKNTGFCDGQYSLPAGHVEAGESAINAMVREAKEEISIDIHSDHLNLVHMRDRNADDGHRIDFFFECSNWEGEIVNAEIDKCSDLQWFDQSNPPPEVIPYIKEVLECALAGRFYSLEDW